MIARRLTTFVAAGTIVLAACGGGETAEPVTDTDVETGLPATPPAAATPSAAPADETTPAADSADEAAEPAETDPPSGEATPDAPPESTSAAQPGPAPTATEAPVIVPAALDFSAQTLDGSEIEMGQYAGRPVLLWFWAPW